VTSTEMTCDAVSDSWCLCPGEGTQCRVDEEKVKKRLVLLLKYLDHKETLELQALYALQTLVHRLEHPPSKHFSLSSILVCVGSLAVW